MPSTSPSPERQAVIALLLACGYERSEFRIEKRKAGTMINIFYLARKNQDRLRRHLETLSRRLQVHLGVKEDSQPLLYIPNQDRPAGFYVADKQGYMPFRSLKEAEAAIHELRERQKELAKKAQEEKQSTKNTSTPKFSQLSWLD